MRFDATLVHLASSNRRILRRAKRFPVHRTKWKWH